MQQIVKRILTRYIVGLIANYDYLREQGNYNTNYVYGQVSTSFALSLRLHLIGAIAIVCSFIMGRLNAYSFGGLALLMFFISILILIFVRPTKLLAFDRYEYLLVLKTKTPEDTLKKLRGMSTKFFITNLLAFIIIIFIANFLGNI